MIRSRLVVALTLAAPLCVSPSLAQMVPEVLQQQQAKLAQENPANHSVRLSVLVFDSSGKPVDDLRVEEVKVFDNKLLRQMTSFHRVILGDRGLQYELTFTATPATKADEYHGLEVQVSRPGLTVKTQKGYLAQVY